MPWVEISKQYECCKSYKYWSKSSVRYFASIDNKREKANNGHAAGGA
jgi:hypothetical protein